MRLPLRPPRPTPAGEARTGGMDRVVRWTPASGAGAEHRNLRARDGGEILAESVVIGERDGAAFGL